MLRNELKEIEKLLADKAAGIDIHYSATGFHELVILIQEAWLNAVFSEQPKSSLERYLQFHLEGISKISDTLFRLGSEDAKRMQEELLSLIDHLREFYHHLISWDAVAPLAYHQSYLNRLNPILTAIRFDLDLPQVDAPLKKVIGLLVEAISVVRERERFTFGNLFYMEKLLRTLVTQDWETEQLSDLLITVLCCFNFNHLSFLKYLQSNISGIAGGLDSQKEMVRYFQLKQAEFSSIPIEQGCAFDNSWPTIKVMITDWLKEQIKFSELGVREEEENLQQLCTDKLGMRISVSYMACLIKLFYEEELFATENLTSIFKFYASNFTSKRQPVISQDSLSKEYYSLDAHTAARIKKILQNMIDRLNRGFFP